MEDIIQMFAEIEIKIEALAKKENKSPIQMERGIREEMLKRRIKKNPEKWNEICKTFAEKARRY